MLRTFHIVSRSFWLLHWDGRLHELSRENSTFVTVVFQIFWTIFANVDKIFPWTFCTDNTENKIFCINLVVFFDLSHCKKVVFTIISRCYEVRTLQNRDEWMKNINVNYKETFLDTVFFFIWYTHFLVAIICYIIWFSSFCLFLNFRFLWLFPFL